MPKNQEFQIQFPEENFQLPLSSKGDKKGKPQPFINPQAIENSDVFLRDNRTAARVFGLYNRTLERLPRTKFHFYVNFIIPDRKNFGQPYSGWDTGVSLAVRSITRPSLSFDVRTLNQYNKKRVVQSKVNFDDITIELYDTRDQRVFKMFKDYYDFYYGDATAETLDWLYDTTMVDYHYPANAKDFGFNPPDTLPDQSYFFERIEVYEFNHTRYNKYSLIKPKIKNFNYDTNDYNDGGTPQLIRLTFSYEGVVWEKINEEISEEILEESGRNLGDFYDIVLEHLKLEARNRKEYLKNIDIPEHTPKKIGVVKPSSDKDLEFKIKTDSGKTPNTSKTSFLTGNIEFAVKNILTRTLVNTTRGAENILQNFSNIPITDILENPKILEHVFTFKDLERGIITDLKLNTYGEINKLYTTSVKQVIDPVTKKIVNIEQTLVKGIRGTATPEPETITNAKTPIYNPYIANTQTTLNNTFSSSIRGLVNKIKSVKRGKTKPVHIKWFLTHSQTSSQGRKSEKEQQSSTNLSKRTIDIFYP